MVEARQASDGLRPKMSGRMLQGKLHIKHKNNINPVGSEQEY